MARLLVASCLILLWTGGKQVPETLKLQWKLQDGDSFFLEEKMASKNVGKVKGTQFTQEQQQLRVWHIVVKKRTNEGAVLEVRLVAWKCKSAGPGSEENDKVVPLMEKALQATVFTFEVTPTGAMISFDGYKQLQQKLTEEKSPLLLGFKVAGGEELFRAPLQGAFDILPAGPVKLGDSWKRETFLPLGVFGCIKNAATFTCAANDKDGVHISVKAVGSFRPSNADPGELGFKILKMDMTKNESTSRIVFNNARGRLVVHEMSMPIAGTVTMEVNGEQIVLQMEGTWSQTTRLLDKKPALELQ
jgi:hypothetical protein